MSTLALKINSWIFSSPKNIDFRKKPYNNRSRLQLFDGSSRGIITNYVTIPVRFPCGTKMIIDFLLTTLDPTCSAVLGHRWLTRYNPRIDWYHGRIEFDTNENAAASAPDITSAEQRTSDTSGRRTDTSPATSLNPPRTTAARTDIRFVSAAAFNMACKMRGAQVSLITVKLPCADSDTAHAFARSASYNPASETGENRDGTRCASTCA